MNHTKVNQKVKIGAVFEGLNIKPKWFFWINKKFEVKNITYQWKSKIGDATIIHFSVSDGTNLYELSFNQKTLEWRLENIEVE
ncbi:MAG: hypothetical protein A2551_00590 [Elusimicrobia bacterium RIFOXYD2_FULL_34_30]|nr:MAG: hypothetical protein A2551_00590 [Elusimicrobia bacterium RIFOXYD2_FULL_34_30]